MSIACWIQKARNTHTHTECVTYIVFPLQQRLHERLSTLRYTYIAYIFLKSYVTNVIYRQRSGFDTRAV